MEDQRVLEISNLLENQDQTISWIESQSSEIQAKHAETGILRLLGEAGQPKSSSGNACVRLCSFVERCSKAKSQSLRDWAFSRDVTEKLFTFYTEWNESDQHRSMKLVLDLIVKLMKKNSKPETAVETERELLKTLVSIVVGTSTKPVVKSAIKIIDHFLTKGVFNIDDLRVTYITCRPEAGSSNDEYEVWRKFFVELFQWMRIHFICPTAGRCIVLLYRTIRARDSAQYPELQVETWNQWLLDFLSENPSLLESVKNYVLLPLFKADRSEALRYLHMASNQKVIGTTMDLEMDMTILLQLTALETGKRVGLVEEPALSKDEEGRSGDDTSAIILDEKILTRVLSHPDHEVRSLALSLLISSPSTTRPYSLSAFSLLQKHLGAYFADTDAKFRVDVVTKARDMFKRVRGSICVLKRSIPRARAKDRKMNTAMGEFERSSEQPVVYQNNLISMPEAQLVNCLEYHEKFLRWYIEFLCGGLTPTASYQRHVGSLKALSSIVRMEGQASKTWETADDQELLYDLFDETWMRALFDLTMDPFDDVRDMSAAALREILSSAKYRRFTLKVPGSTVSSSLELRDLMNRSKALAGRTARADHADGAARGAQLVYKFLASGDERLSFLSDLVEQLEGKLAVAQKDLGRAVLEAPVHGDFAALRYIWQVASETKFEQAELDSVRGLQLRIIDCCSRVWNSVKSILCDDSPEGHLPQELEEVDGINTKDVLSYSFRSVHESSNLMRTVVLTIRNKDMEGVISPSSASFAKIGNLSFNQLSTLRHRGAFTTVSTTFATCCQQTKYLGFDGASRGDGLLEEWYKGTMEAIFAQVYTTRRSAGIPSLMTGILSANAPNPSFEQVMEKLMEIASMEARVREKDGTNLPQVHAYNCLKDIFKNSLLTSMGNKSDKYIPQCLELAANGLKCEVWAIRNCGLILLRSLIDCLFGSNESKSMIEAGWDGKTNRIAYHRYPTIPGVLVNLLKSGHRMMSATAADPAGAESVFPSLDIVRRAGPPDLLRDELQVHIAKYLSSPVWHVREMAARTLCSCLLHQQWLGVIKGILQDAINDTTQNSKNHVHGVLLVLKFVIERLGEVGLGWLINNLTDLVSMLKDSKVDEKYGYCPDILAAYLEVVNSISALSLRQSLPVERIDVTLPQRCGSALLKIQTATYRIYTAIGSMTPVEELRAIFLGGDLGADTMATALELLAKIWTASTTPDELVPELCSFYMDLCCGTALSEPRTVAVENLASIIECRLAKGEFDDVDFSRLTQLWATLPFSPVNPSLSNAVLRISGCVTAILQRSQKLPASGLQGWGLMLADAGQDDKGFDTRFSAAGSLRTFFAATGTSCTTEEYLPVLMALYDALNDDDDEVRDEAAAAVKSLIGDALTPLEASDRLVTWLTATFASSDAMRETVVARLTGARSTTTLAWKPASAQLDDALTVDDSLFAVEEQNLFIDEVREAKRWTSALVSMDWSSSSSPLLLKKLDSWLQEGLVRLQKLLEDGYDKGYGPSGWASIPQPFAVCSLVLLGSVTMVTAGHATLELRNAIDRVSQAMRSPNNYLNISGLLVQHFKTLHLG
ncbi:hypothetical protein GMORB2_5862 [Geosmithia morbida]|uniref:DUF2428 domain-containing protein n=1 Tax=Geosmithia morbida TaxID=1094350 RepID=A0A9P4YW15_9HYPO|nr:uncharacterized protein GMORB2_5862 [Geosmithia morbida]KAF4124146.1 hypothetical protein GMORB2_5862 [Geosmithia morbida]